MARSNSGFLEHLLVGGWRAMKFPQEMLLQRKWHLRVKESVKKNPITPSFVSMWPNNFELLSMVKKASKRKHILEFPLFKKNGKSNKNWSLNKENTGWKEVLRHTNTHTQTHTHTCTQNTMHTWTHTSKNVYLYGRFLEIDILSKYGWQINCNLFSFNTVSS